MSLFSNCYPGHCSFCIRIKCNQGHCSSQLDVNEHPFGDYSRLLFVYHKIGFQFTFDKIIIALNDSVSEVGYYVPGTLQEYLDQFYRLETPNSSKRLKWDDAVH